MKGVKNDNGMALWLFTENLVYSHRYIESVMKVLISKIRA